MSKQNIKILAIDPGTKNMGFAFFEGEKLIHYGVKDIQKGRTPHETLKSGREAILRLITGYMPEVLAIEKTYFGKHKERPIINAFVDEIIAIGKKKRLKVVTYAPNTVKKQTCGDGRASKEEVARVVVSKYPELKVFMTQDRKWKERYHQNMFDAVALGIMVDIWN